VKILITGSSGFLGSHLVQRLANNHEIFGISKKSDALSKNIGKNILTLKKIPSDIDCIIHLAALTDVQYCQNNPKECFEINFMGTQNMLDLARKNDCKFILPTSSLIFGNPKKPTLSENSPINPITIHGASKAACEIISKSYSNLYGMNIITTRLFSIYGPNNPSYSIIHRIISQLLNNKKIILGNTSTKRDFLFVSDFTCAIELLVNSNLNGFEQFNIGSGSSNSILSICKKLLKISGKSIPIKIDKNLIRPNDIKNLISDSSKLQKLGWKPKISLEKGLEITYDWFKTL
jgi:nucleoside-diphosphate-sugar epimerase